MFTAGLRVSLTITAPGPFLFFFLSCSLPALVLTYKTGSVPILYKLLYRTLFAALSLRNRPLSLCHYESSCFVARFPSQFSLWKKIGKSFPSVQPFALKRGSGLKLATAEIMAFPSSLNKRKWVQQTIAELGFCHTRQVPHRLAFNVICHCHTRTLP